MSVMRFGPTGITGIIIVWSNFDNFQKALKSISFLGEKCPPPPKLKLRTYLAGFHAMWMYTS